MVDFSLAKARTTSDNKIMMMFGSRLPSLPIWKVLMHARLGLPSLLLAVALMIFPGAVSAQQAEPSPPAKTPADKKGAEVKSPEKDGDKLPLTKLKPAKVLPNLCLLKYRVTTSSPECQALVDQGLGFFYSYVWMEAARSFETAVRLDPQCGMAWWGL